MNLQPTESDAHAVWAALTSALEGRRPIALGFVPDADAEVADGAAVVIATSGSSGIPKRVILSGAALRASAQATAARIGTGQWMLALSAGYVAGLQVLVRSHVAGTQPVILDGHFTPQAFLDATENLHPGIPHLTSLVPAQLATLLDAVAEHPEMTGALAAYDAILVGGQAISPALLERALDAGARIVRTYGSSETAGGCVYDGVPLEGVRVTTVDGELRIAGPTLATGYLGDDALTARTFVDGGTRWYRTGDTGEVAADGTISVHGRADNVIISGGINVSLDRVERVVRTVPGLEQAVVLGMADERWGQASVVFVARGTRDPKDMFEDARTRVAEQLGKHARPAQLEELPELPMLASGKPDREQLRRLIAD